jgi:molybdopterin converting factor small subunit
MKVKVLKLGEAATEVDLPAGSNVGDAISAAKYSDAGHTRTLNGQVVFDSTKINDGDVVTLAPKVEGGSN